MAAAAAAQPVIINGVNPMVMPGSGKQAPGQVPLPYMTPDTSGGMWFIYNDGALRQQMGPGVYQQGGMLTIDGNGFSAANNQGTRTASGELLLRNPDMGSVAVTRRIFFDKEHNYVRYVDVLHNSSRQDVSVNVMIQTSLNWGVQQSQLIPDPQHKDQNLAWTGMTNMGRAVLEVYGGSGGKLQPTITAQNGGNVIQASFTVTVPARKEASIMHLHLFVPTLAAGSQFISDLNTAQLVHSLPADVRRSLVNFSAEQDWMGDLSILRGDAFDIVELRGGDQLKGTLTANSYNLTTFYGPVELSSARVVGLLNVGLSRPRQLVVTDDGEIFGGRLDQQTIDITLTGGQTVHVPLEQISRVGFRKRANEPDQWTFDQPLVLMRGGDRVLVKPPTGKIQAATRYGTLELDPSSVAAIAFQTEEGGVHQIFLTDGSRLAGLICGDNIEMELGGAGPQQTVQFPVSGMLRLQLVAKMPDADANSPSLTLTNQDLLCGALQGRLSLQTAFDVITLDAAQIRHIARSGTDLQVTTWDGSIIDGWIAQTTAPCQLSSGAVLNVPLALMSEYNQPFPLPSPDMVKQIEASAADLNADDWRQRDHAEAALTSMGPAVIGVLRSIRPAQPPEAQQRIDSIIKKVQPSPAQLPSPPNPDETDKP